MRFIGIILIMGHHLYHIGYESEYYFENCWTWVDFFFILTGAFSYRHFGAGERNAECNYGDRAISYTLGKFKRFVPLTVLAVIIQYLLDYRSLIVKGDVKGIIYIIFENAPFEIMYLSSSGIKSAVVAPIWFLSAMFIVFPISIYMMQAHHELWKIVAFTSPILYFGHNGVNTVRSWPNDLVRAFVCMSIGTLAFLAASYFKDKCIDKKRKIFFSTVEIGSIILAIYISVCNKDCTNILEPLFFLICALLLSGSTWSYGFKSKIIHFLGKMSMPMFILHWGVGTLVNIMVENLSIRSFLYFGCTMLLSAVYVMIINERNKYEQYRGK